jgi:hypothetical protein
MSMVFPDALPAVLPVFDELLEHPAAARATIAPVTSTGASPGASLLPFTIRVLSFGCPSARAACDADPRLCSRK